MSRKQTNSNAQRAATKPADPPVAARPAKKKAAKKKAAKKKAAKKKAASTRPVDGKAARTKAARSKAARTKAARKAPQREPPQGRSRSTAERQGSVVLPEVAPAAGRPVLVVGGVAIDQQPLIDRLAQTHALVRWQDDGPSPMAGAIALVDLRQGFDLARLQGASVALVVAVTKAQGPPLDSRPLDVPLLLVGDDWAPDLVSSCIAFALDNQRGIEAACEREVAHLRRQMADGEEAQDIELLVKDTELARLKDFKSGVLKRLGDGERGYLADLVRHARRVVEEPDLPSAIRSSVDAIGRAAHSIEQVFEQEDLKDQVTATLSGRTILVAAAGIVNPQRRLLVRALIGTGASVEAVSTAEAGLDILRREPVDILYVDWPNVSLIASARQINPALHIVLMTSEMLFAGAGRQMLELPLSNVLITSDIGGTEARDQQVIRELTVTAGKLLSGDIFGLEKYLGWGAAVREASVTGSRQRYDLMDRISEYAPRCGLKKSLCRNLETLTDELLMNAIWDAPLDEHGKSKYSQRPRDQPLELEPHERALLRYGSDSDLLGISVIDRFGGLQRDRAFEYLVRCFAKQDDQIDTSTTGAGLGLYFAFLAVSTFVINVAPGTRTEVIGLLDMNLSARELTSRPRSYLYFRSPRPAPPLTFANGDAV